MWACTESHASCPDIGGVVPTSLSPGLECPSTGREDSKSEVFTFEFGI